MGQLEKHEKAIRLLNAISECESIISEHQNYFTNVLRRGDGWHENRIIIMTAVKTKIENYYNKSFKI